MFLCLPECSLRHKAESDFVALIRFCTERHSDQIAVARSAFRRERECARIAPEYAVFGVAAVDCDVLHAFAARCKVQAHRDLPRGERLCPLKGAMRFAEPYDVGVCFPVVERLVGRCAVFAVLVSRRLRIVLIQKAFLTRLAVGIVIERKAVPRLLLGILCVVRERKQRAEAVVFAAFR